MRTSAPFSPLRTLLLLLPFFVVPAVVIFGTPRFGTLESYSPATASPAPKTATPPEEDQLPRADKAPVSSLPRDSEPRSKRRQATEFHEQPRQTSSADRRWSAVHSGQEMGQGISRANLPGSLASASNRRPLEAGQQTNRGIPRTVSNTASSPPSLSRTGPGNHPQVIETTESRQGVDAPAVSRNPFPLGTSISLSNRPARRATGREPAKLKIDRHKPSSVAQSADQTRARLQSSEVLRAQQPDSDPAVREASFEQQATLSWKEAQRQFERLGVARYSLQTWGTKGQYLFSCSVPANSNSPINRRFEARADDPMLAVARVLDDIERWRKTLESP